MDNNLYCIYYSILKLNFLLFTRTQFLFWSKMEPTFTLQIFYAIFFIEDWLYCFILFINGLLCSLEYNNCKNYWLNDTNINMFCLSVKCEREIRVRKGERERETGRETKATFSLCKLLSRFSLSLYLYLFIWKCALFLWRSRALSLSLS